MEQFAKPEFIGALYTIGSCLAVLAFLFFAKILRVFGNVRLTIWLAVIEIIALILLGLASSAATAIVAFVIFVTINPLIYLTIDIFSESLIGNNETSTGSKRGLTLTLMSLAAVMGPATMGLIVGDNSENLRYTYFVSAAIFALFVLIVAVRFRSFTDPEYHDLKIAEAIRSFWVHRDVRNVFFAHLTLQLFFSWAIIYIPLYMATEIGFTWDVIGSIIAVGLMAYVVFEWPIGYIADRYLGEKEMMAVGFVILAVTSSWVAFMTASSVIAWMILMFINRTGASLVEATTESYFFKHTVGNDANVMSFFRLTRPLGVVMGSLLGSATLLYFRFDFAFIILGFLMIPGIYFASRLKDTR